MKNLFIIITNFAFIFSNSLYGQTSSHMMPGEYIVKLKRPLTTNLLASELNSFVKNQNVKAKLAVVIRPMFEDTNSAIAALEQNPIVEYAEPNFIYHLTNIPNDLFLGEQWGLNNIGQKDGQKRRGIPGIDIGVLEAWDITTGSDKVIVALIDSGINYNHPDLKDNIWTNAKELSGKKGIDDDGNGYVDDLHGYNFVGGKELTDPMDVIGHGTHCAGIIGARGNNGLGIVGVNWNVKLMPIKFISESGEGATDAAIKSIDYAIANGAKIINASWGGGDYSKALEEAIERANQHGVLFIAAAGNDNADNDHAPFYPASYPNPNVISVAAIDNQGRLAEFSNFGKNNVQIAAPGMNIASTVITDYVVASGTSMAAPFVSGVAALLIAHEPQLSHLEIKERILSTTKPIPGLQGKILNRGLVNAHNALTNTLTTPPSEDPSNWQNIYTLPKVISSDHPYLNKTNLKFTIVVPNAKHFSLFLPKVSVDYGFDFVIIKDAAGNIVDKISDRKRLNSYSAIVNGDTATVEFIADKDINGWGFEITKAVWR